MEEKRPGLQKALRVLAILMLIFGVLAFLFVAFTYLFIRKVFAKTAKMGTLVCKNSAQVRLFMCFFLFYK